MLLLIEKHQNFSSLACYAVVYYKLANLIQFSLPINLYGNLLYLRYTLISAESVPRPTTKNLVDSKYCCFIFQF